MDNINAVSGAQPSKVHMWILILLGWTAVFSLLSVGLLLTKNTDPGLSTTELSAACQNGVLNGITTNLTRISEACSDAEVASDTVPIHIASSMIPAEITPDTQATYIASMFPADRFTDVAITTQSFPNGTLYTVTDTLIGSAGNGKELSMHFFGTTTLVVMSYTNTDLSSINTEFDWSQVK